MARSSQDLFDDSTMSFGEHLEVLRVHLFKALIGVAIGVVVALFYGSSIVAIVRQPIDRALHQYGQGSPVTDDAAALEQIDFWAKVKTYFREQFSLDAFTGDDEPEPEEPPAEGAAVAAPRKSTTIRVHVDVSQLGAALHEVDAEAYPAPSVEATSKTVPLDLSAPEFSQFRSMVKRSQQVVALSVQEPFLIYIKVSMIAGLVIASPWVFYQLWQFVAAGLFPHERKFVYLYGTLSGILFFGGVVFSFYLVFPFVLKFLLSFYSLLETQPQIRLSEWISMAVTLPLLFGVSFQLPLVMLFLERLSIFEVSDYQEKRRMAVLVIAVLSMFLTPADPISMLLMMVPLCGLYQLGIWLCRISPAKSPFDGELATR